MRWAIVAVLVLGYGATWADELPKDEKQIKTLTADQAKTLLQERQFAFLRLDGLTSLDAETAKTLADHDGWLLLNGLTKLTPEVAEALAKLKNGVSLNGLTSLTPEIAEALAQLKGELSLDGLTTLTPEIAESLAQREGDLSLGGLTMLSPEAAEALANLKGGLSFQGLSTLSPEAAGELARHKHTLSFPTITVLEPALAKVLVDRRGDTHIVIGLNMAPEEMKWVERATGRPWNKFQLSEHSASKLHQHRGLLRLHISAAMTRELAESLTAGSGKLSIDMNSISPEIAEALSQRRAPLFLDKLDSLSLEAAEHLANHKGELSLNGVQALTATKAKVLATHKGRLSLNGIRTLSDEALAALQANPEISLPEKFQR